MHARRSPVRMQGFGLDSTQRFVFSILSIYRVYHNEVNSLKNDSELKNMKYLVN